MGTLKYGLYISKREIVQSSLYDLVEYCVSENFGSQSEFSLFYFDIKYYIV